MEKAKNGLFMVTSMAALMLMSGVAFAEATDWCWEGDGYNCDGCDGDGVAFALECQGGYCAATRNDCDNNGFSKTSNEYWTEYFSEEDGLNEHNYCAPGYVVDRMDCDGWDNFCDNVALHCVEISATEGSCYWSNVWISEEAERDPDNDYIGRYTRCGPGEYIHGVTCTGPYCDQMQINCCPYTP